MRSLEMDAHHVPPRQSAEAKEEGREEVSGGENEESETPLCVCVCVCVYNYNIYIYIKRYMYRKKTCVVCICRYII